MPVNFKKLTRGTDKPGGSFEQNPSSHFKQKDFILIKDRFYVWWISIALISTGLFWSFYSGIIKTILDRDSTHITLVIAIVFAIGTLSLGYAAYLKTLDNRFDLYQYEYDGKINSLLDTAWFISDLLMGLGMAGTVIGIILLLGIDQTINVQDTAALNTLLNKMWSALGVAFFPNAVGLLSSIILKIQTHLISK